MKKKWLLVCGVLLAIMLCVVLALRGCGSTAAQPFNTILSNGEFKIALLGSDQNFANREDFINGLNLSVQELNAKGTNIKVEKISVNGGYDPSIAKAKEIISDSTFKMGISLQLYDIGDTVASLFEEARKPFIFADGSYTETMKNDYKYILNLIVGADESGRALGAYALQKGAKRVATLHSKTKYEIDLIKGVAASVSGSSITQLVDSVDGPNNPQELTESMALWKALGVDCFVVSFYDDEWVFELIKRIKEAFPTAMILSDFTLNVHTKLEQYKGLIDGVVIASPFPVDSDSKINEFYSTYESRVKKPDLLTSISAQGYDLINMIAKVLKDSKPATALDFIKAMKTKEGYQGYAGLRFKDDGRLDKTPKYWVVKGAQVYRMES